jgi:hypothetical protein
MLLSLELNPRIYLALTETRKGIRPAWPIVLIITVLIVSLLACGARLARGPYSFYWSRIACVAVARSRRMLCILYLQNTPREAAVRGLRSFASLRV